MDNSEMAKAILNQGIQTSVKQIQKTFFEIIDDLKVTDADNFDDLVEILKDETLAKKFQIFQENRSQAIRKKILDGTGTLYRDLVDKVDKFDIKINKDTEVIGIFK